MANELLPINRGELRAEVEVTYDTDPGLAAGTAIYAETFTATVSDGLQPRNGMSPYGPGFKAFPTLRTGEFSGQVFISPLTLTVGSEVPTIDPILRLVGFGAGVTATPTGSKTRTYTMEAHGQGSTSLQLIEYDEADANGTKTLLTGCRAQGTIKLVGEGAGTIDFSGAAATSTVTNNAAGPVTLTYADDCPIVGGAGTVTLTELGGDAAFGGLLFDAEWTLYPVTASNGLTGRVIQMRPDGSAIGLAVNLEQQTLDDWDVHAYAAAKTAITVHIALPAAVAGGDSVEFDCTAQIIDVSSDDGPAGNKTWGLAMILLFPEVGSDGGGLVPSASAFTVTYRTTDP